MIYIGMIYVGRLPTPTAAQPAQDWSTARASDALISELAFAQPMLQTYRSQVLTELAKLARDPDSQTRAEWLLLQKLAALTHE